MMTGQYLIGSDLIDRGDLMRLVALEKNGVINLLMIMTLYGVFIPNDPRETARRRPDHGDRTVSGAGGSQVEGFRGIVPRRSTRRQ